MNVLKGIYYQLTNDGPVAAIIGTKCYPSIAPQRAVVPFVVCSIVSNDPADTKSGVSDCDTFRIQIDSYAATYDAAQDLDRKVRTAIDKQTGTWAGVVVDGVRYLNSNDIFEDDPMEHRRSSDYIFRVKY